MWTDHDAAVAAAAEELLDDRRACGDPGPDGMQDLLTRVRWDDAAVRADVRDFIGEQLGAYHR